ncbi:MAG: RrF2 family transcriptional regulator [Desulfobulbus sp.]|jgi:Rrf2 family protein
MRLTRAAEYAVRCILYLARQGEGVLTSRQKIASQADIPPHFLAKIAQDLARAGLIEIRLGARGGFCLCRSPASISLLTVVEAMIGEIGLNDCVLRPDSCTGSPYCAIHQIWKNARDQLRANLGAISFEDLANDTSCALLYDALHNASLESRPSPGGQEQ